MKCKNCGEDLTQNYCSNCGQKANTTRFTWSHIWHKIADSIDIDKGFFHTIYYLIRNPGKIIREYLQGKRAGVYNPLKLSLIASAITTIVVIETGTFGGDNPVQLPFGIDPAKIEDIEGYFLYSGKYFTFFSFTGVLIFIVSSWLVFIKLGYNFIEHFLANIYIMVGQWCYLFRLL